MTAGSGEIFMPFWYGLTNYPCCSWKNVRALLTTNAGAAFAEVCHSLDTLGTVSHGELCEHPPLAPVIEETDGGELHFLPTPRAQNGELRNHKIWQRPLGQPQNLENVIARLPIALALMPQLSDGGNESSDDTPDPLDDGKINPRFVEWQMGYPDGWVTDTLLDRGAALKALGNAVVPQCAASAYSQLVQRMEAA